MLGLLFTLIMGLTFLGLQIREYALLHGEASRPSTARSRACSSPSPGCTACTSSWARSCSRRALVRALRGHYSPAKHMGVELSGIYWHFVDVVWVVLYTLVYLLSNGARAPL